ncbi:MAG: helix-turn-helix domain-containing protein [Eggerthellaceae bacterium]|nr:helix-turn-helix domain-containing protein [Eggerthellaceae bacterium]
MPAHYNISFIQPFFINACAGKYLKKCINDTAIDHVYTFRSQEDCEKAIIVPDGCIDIEFRCDPDNPDAFLCGTVTSGQPRPFRAGVDYFGVRYRPRCLTDRLGVSSSELIDSRISLRLVSSEGERLIQQVVEAEDFSHRVEALLHSTINAKISLTEPFESDLVNGILNIIIARKGDIRVNELALFVGYSVRHLNSLFVRYLGIGPKTFCRFIRFQNLLNHIGGFKGALSQAAVEFGYFDHSHMAREFKAYTTLTPKKYLQEVGRLSYENSDEA